jgi:hypothetical protein
MQVLVFRARKWPQRNAKSGFSISALHALRYRKLAHFRENSFTTKSTKKNRPVGFFQIFVLFVLFVVKFGLRLAALGPSVLICGFNCALKGKRAAATGWPVPV